MRKRNNEEIKGTGLPSNWNPNPDHSNFNVCVSTLTVVKDIGSGDKRPEFKSWLVPDTTLMALGKFCNFSVSPPEN